MVAALGTSSRSSSSRLVPSTALNSFTPVGLPPGRLRLATSPPLVTGSLAADKDDRNVVSRRLRREREGRPPVAIITATCASNQFGRQRRQPIVLPLGPAVFDRHVLALDITGFFRP